MTARDKSKIRMILTYTSFFYIIGFCTVAFGFHLLGFPVITFWPIFSGVIGYLSSLGVANLFTTPMDT